MRGRTHLLTGYTTWATGCALVTAQPSLPWLLGGGMLAGAGALLPDLDQTGSTAARSLGFVSLLAAWIVRAVSGGHRKGTHSLAGYATAGLIINGVYLLLCGVAHLPVPLWAPMGLLIGWAVHVAGDMLTWAGCPLLYPWSLQRQWLLPGWLRFHTGGNGGAAVGEGIVAALAISLCAVVVWWRWLS